MHSNPAGQLLSTRQLADALGVSESSIKRWIDDGTIDAHRTAGGHRRIPLAAAVRFMRAHGHEPQRPQELGIAAVPRVGETDDDAAESFWSALHRDDPAQARAVIHGNYLAGADVAAIGDRLIAPAMRRLGELWRSDDAGVLIEHRAVDTCVRILTELSEWLPPIPEDAPAAVTSGVAADPYILPPLLTSLVLRERGFRARNLGPFIPPETIAMAADRYGARLCCVSVSVDQDARSESGWVSLAKGLRRKGGALIAGGRCITALPAGVREVAHVGGSLGELAAFSAGLIHGAAKDGVPSKRRARGG